jgi:ABC-type lipoprotein release transport system permease subunit
MSELLEARRQEATRTFIRYFILAFLVVLTMSALVAYAVYDGMARRQESHALRLAYCVELEKLKTQNRAEVREDQKNYRRNLRLLGINDTPELRKAVREGWARDLARNAPRPCPYEG